MAKSGDWMPAARTGILTMAHEQLAYMTPERRTLWGIPEEQFAGYQTRYGAAQSALEKVMDKAERTHGQTVEYQTAFDALKETMAPWPGPRPWTTRGTTATRSIWGSCPPAARAWNRRLPTGIT